MTHRIVHRPARTTPSVPDLGPFGVEGPPEMPDVEGNLRSLLMMLPLLGAGASMTVMMVFRGSSFAAVGALMMIMTVIGTGALFFGQRGRQAQERRVQRERYLDYLEETRVALAEQERAHVEAATLTHPPATALVSLVRRPDRLWERRRGDRDYLHVRLGLGTSEPRPFSRYGEQNPLSLTDEFMETELDLVRQRFEVAREAPLVVDLSAAGQVSVVGDRAFRERVGRLLVAQAATLTSPEDLALGLVAPPARREAWDCVQWLPHLADQRRTTARGPVRRITATVPAMRRMLTPELDRRAQDAAEAQRDFLGRAPTRHARVLVVVDTDGRAPVLLDFDDAGVEVARLGLTVVHLLDDRLDEPGDVRLRITQRPDDEVLVERYTRGDAEPARQVGRLDELGVAETEALCRELAGLRLSPDSLEHDPRRQVAGVSDLLGVPDVTAPDFDRLWQPRLRTQFLRVPIGHDDHGDPVLLDLKEAAQFGMGPHGLCVGATGSGKSELLRTLVLGLLTTHGPEDVAMVLVDYKGGATFAPFAGAPQVSGIITNLSDDAALVERVYESLAGEVQRRQELLKSVGHLPDITSYRALRAEQGPHTPPDQRLEPLPHLLVIIDEFGELLTARPDFIELFLSIGRIGRSIGVHLLLSSQRIEGGRLRGLETYLSYRIGLRTLSEAESRTVLDTKDAFSLPPIPGYGYLKVDTTTYTRFRAGFVSGPLPADDDVDDPVDVPPEVTRLGVYADDDLADDTDAAAEEARPEVERRGPSVVDVLVARLREQDRAVTPVWLPPMPDQLTLDQAAGPPTATSAGLRVPRRGFLRVPLGLVDDPTRQWQGVWDLDLRVAGGHVLVIGGPGSGRTTALRTLTASLALTHGPDEVVVYAVDLLGSNLVPLGDLPHVGGVAVRMDRDAVRRTVEEVMALLTERERLMQRLGAESVAGLRRLAADGHPELAGVLLAEVVVLVDGYGQLADEFDDLDDHVTSLLRRGGGHGIHVVATAARWNDVRVRQQGYFGTRIELRLSDPAESGVKRTLAEAITTDRPGRCLLSDGLFAQLALPRVDGDADRDSAVAGLRDLAERVAAATTVRAPQVRVLPPVVTAAEVDPAPRPGVVPIGLEESRLATVQLDLAGADRNLVAIGDPETGRTSLLRHVAETLVAQHTPEEIVFAVVDPRRSLGEDVVPPDYLGGYAGSTRLAEQLVAAVLPELEKRVPDSVEAQRDLRLRLPTPWIVVLVDDYDVLTAGGQSPLRALVPSIAASGEVNLSVLLTRRTSGASRGVFDPVFSALRDSGGAGLLFSGDRSEGQLLGSVRPRALPQGRAALVRTGADPLTVQLVHPGPAETDPGVGRLASAP